MTAREASVELALELPWVLLTLWLIETKGFRGPQAEEPRAAFDHLRSARAHTVELPFSVAGVWAGALAQLIVLIEPILVVGKGEDRSPVTDPVIDPGAKFQRQHRNNRTGDDAEQSAGGESHA